MAFSPHVAHKLKNYVYRLVDPRTGETFYVGRGVGNRVFAHVREKSAAGEEASEKLDRIRDIQRTGFEVVHIIHRHGLTDRQAREVEAALIDAYAHALNEVGGFGVERGLRHVDQVVRFYDAKEAKFRHKAVLITVNRSLAEKGDVYEGVRYAWKLDPARAGRAQFVMALDRGLIVGVFKPERWMKATPENFPGTAHARRGRWGFVGRPASPAIRRQYMHRRLPPSMRKQGAANPVRYVNV
jgi:uncharacterized protein